jgi:histidyl-tRNA synthetase
LLGAEANRISDTIQKLRTVVENVGYQEFIPSTLAYAETFEKQMGDNRVFAFDDLAGRKLVLIPEVTAIARQEYDETWSKTLPKPVRLWYAQRCYRYDKPQRGRYREFWQFGIECMGKFDEADTKMVLRDCLKTVGLDNYEWNDSIKRGLGYYVENGFEVQAAGLQLAGGGRYPEGIGWAIGIERLLIALSENA